MAWLPLIAAVAMLLCFYLCTLGRQMLALDEYSQLDVVDEQLEGVRYDEVSDKKGVELDEYQCPRVRSRVRARVRVSLTLPLPLTLTLTLPLPLPLPLTLTRCASRAGARASRAVRARGCAGAASRWVRSRPSRPPARSAPRVRARARPQPPRRIARRGRVHARPPHVGQWSN